MNDILVSIIIPVFNAERYLSECLNSIITQTHKNIEVICINDGSTDSSADILYKYAMMDKRVRVICQENRYAGMARERGLQEASGKYVMFLDADDFFSDSLIETLLHDIEQNNADIAICDENAIDGNTNQTIMFSTFSPLFKNLGDMHVFSPEKYSQYIFNIVETHVWDKMFRLDFVRKKNIYFQNSKVINDALFCQLAMANAKKIVVSQEKLVTYRIHVENSISKSRFSHWYCAYEMLNLLRKELEVRDIFQRYKQSYMNYAASVIADYLMCSITDVTFFVEAFDYYKKKAKKDFLFTDYPKSYYHRQDVYDIILRLDRMDIVEFLCSRVLDLKKKEREILDLNLMILGWKTEFVKVTNSLKVIIENKKWEFPKSIVPKGAKIVLYGYGDIGRDYSAEIKKCNDYDLVAIADKDAKKLTTKIQPIISMNDILKLEWDYIVLALFDKDTVAIVRRQFEEKGVAPEKIIWKNPIEES